MTTFSEDTTMYLHVQRLINDIAAERTIQLPPRDTKASEKKQAQQEEDERRGRALRESRGTDPNSDEH